MFAEIITIGDEILIGQIVDTNSTFIAKALNKIGISVYQISSVQDDRVHILKALEEARSRASIIIVTGGLGPTKDDVTKHTFCEFFNDVLIENKGVLRHVEHLFKTHITTAPISEMNRRQALVPSKAAVLHNAYGTAPGMWFEEEGTVFVSLPGVPFEMENLMEASVIPRLADTFDRPYILHKTLVTYGLGESAIAERIEEWEDSLPSFIRLAYLPSLGKVRLRLTAKGPDGEVLEKAIAEEVQKVYPLIRDILYRIEDDQGLEEILADICTAKKLTLATAESFTGGKIAQLITAIPGASAYFKGSVVSYATEAKINVLHVPRQLIDEHSVVSLEVACAMAENVRKLLKADLAVATTGNAGPTKGDSDAEVGTVCIGIASSKGVYAEKFNMGNHRERIVEKSVNKSFELLQKEILKL